MREHKSIDDSINDLVKYFGKVEGQRLFRDFNESYMEKHKLERTKDYYKYLVQKEKDLMEYVKIMKNTSGNLGLM